MSPSEPKLFTGHDAETGTDFLLTVYDNGERELATRPGRDDTAATWSAPVTLTGVSA
jgi:hypothetical protein